MAVLVVLHFARMYIVLFDNLAVPFFDILLLCPKWRYYEPSPSWYRPEVNYGNDLTFFRGVFHSKIVQWKKFSKLDNHLVFVFIFTVIPKSCTYWKWKTSVILWRVFFSFLFFLQQPQGKALNSMICWGFFFIFIFIFNFRTYKDIFNSFWGRGDVCTQAKNKDRN